MFSCHRFSLYIYPPRLSCNFTFNLINFCAILLSTSSPIRPLIYWWKNHETPELNVSKPLSSSSMCRIRGERVASGETHENAIHNSSENVHSSPSTNNNRGKIGFPLNSIRSRSFLSLPRLPLWLLLLFPLKKSLLSSVTSPPAAESPPHITHNRNIPIIITWRRWCRVKKRKRSSRKTHWSGNSSRIKVISDGTFDKLLYDCHCHHHHRRVSSCRVSFGGPSERKGKQ